MKSKSTIRGDRAPTVFSAPKHIVQQVWPSATVALGLGLAVVWVCFLGYVLFKMVEFAI